MNLDRRELKRWGIQRRVHSSKVPRVLTAGTARRLRTVLPAGETYVVIPKPVGGPPSSDPSALEKAALRALGSEQPREVSPEDVYRLMSPSPESTGWGKELAEDRRNIVAEDPWQGR